MHMFTDLPASSHVATCVRMCMCSNLEDHMPFVPRPTDTRTCSDLNTHVHRALEQLLSCPQQHTSAHTCSLTEALHIGVDSQVPPALTHSFILTQVPSQAQMHAQHVLNAPQHLHVLRAAHACVDPLWHACSHVKACIFRVTHARSKGAGCTCMFRPEHVHIRAQSHLGTHMYMCSDLYDPTHALRLPAAHRSFGIAGAWMHVQNSCTHSVLRPARVQVHKREELGLTEVYV